MDDSLFVSVLMCVLSGYIIVYFKTSYMTALI